jgi:hypothetical protein
MNPDVKKSFHSSTEKIDEADQSLEDEGVPALVLQVDEGVDLMVRTSRGKVTA